MYKNNAILLSKVQKKKKNTENINPVVSKTKNGGTMILSKCAICRTKKSRFIQKQEAKGLLSNLDLKTSLSYIPILAIFCFKYNFIECNRLYTIDCIK